MTGAARGIGRAIALALAQPGLTSISTMWSWARRPSGPIRKWRPKGPGPGWSNSMWPMLAQVEQGVDDILKESGRLDILVNNAGITRDNLIVRMKEDRMGRGPGREPQGRL